MNLVKEKELNIKSIGKWIYDNIFVLALSALIIIFIAFPIISVLLKSIEGEKGFSLEFYKMLFNEDMFSILGQSLALSFASSFITATLVLILTLGIYLSGIKFQKIMRKVLLFTIISPPFVTAISMIILFGRRGLISYGLFRIKWNIYGWQGILLIQVLSTLSFGIMLLSNSFDNLDENAIRASQDLGASPLRTIMNIIIPGVMPGFLSLFFILFTMNFADFGTPVIIGGKFQTIATESYNAVLSTGDLNIGAAMSSFMIPPTILAFYFYSKMMKKSKGNVEAKVVISKRLDFKVPLVLKVFLYFFMFLFILFNILKYGTILLSTVTNNATGKLRFTLEYFSRIESVSINAFKRSIWYSLTAATFSVIIGTALSYYIYRSNKKLKVIEFLSSLPYIIPGTFFGLGYLVAFNKEPIFITGTAAIVILNLCFRQISISNKTANSVFSKIDRKIELAGKDLGANRWQIIRTIIIPMCIPIFATSFAQVFTQSMTAFGAIMFLVSPGKMVASAEMFRLIKGGGTAVGSILAVSIILITGFFNLLITTILKRIEGKNVS